jgi:hypothetical protein
LRGDKPDVTICRSFWCNPPEFSYAASLRNTQHSSKHGMGIP